MSYVVSLANPSFAGSLDYESYATDLLQMVKTKKKGTEGNAEMSVAFRSAKVA